MSRLVRMQLAKQTPQFPKITNGFYLIEYLQELSFGQYQNGQLVSLDYNIVKSWLELSGLSLSFQEIKAILALSSSYVYTLHKATDKEFKQPYIKD